MTGSINQLAEGGVALKILNKYCWKDIEAESLAKF